MRVTQPKTPWRANTLAVFGKGVAAVAVAAAATLAMTTTSSLASGNVPKQTGATIEICKAGWNISGTYKFTIDNGTPISIGAQNCLDVSVSPGTHVVKELYDTTGKTELQNIVVTPPSALVHMSLSGHTAAVKVASGKIVTLKYWNAQAYNYLKVCKVAGDPSLMGNPYSFTETAGGSVIGPFSVRAGPTSPLNCGGLTKYPVGTKVTIKELPAVNTMVSNIQVVGSYKTYSNLSTRTVVAVVGPVGHGVTEVIYTNVANTPPVGGFIEVCKVAGDSYVSGSFTFTITNASGFKYTQSVPVGQCTGDISVPAGEVTVTEAPNAPYYLSGVWAVPSGALESYNLANGTATFTVASNATTTAFFQDSTATGLVKVCKTLAPNAGALVGQTFNFMVSSAFGTQYVNVTAAPVGQTACAIDYTPLPIGAMVSITETGMNGMSLADANVQVTGISVIPSWLNAGSSGATANINVGNNITAVTFTDQALSWIEVCKVGADLSTQGQVFTFSINGGAPFGMTAGTAANPYCSEPFQVPAGTATVYELPLSNFALVGVSTVSPTDPTGSRLLSGPTANPALVSVPWGGQANETIVTFTNRVVTGSFKICTTQTSPDANLFGQTFTYIYSYTVNGVTTSGNASLTVGGPNSCIMVGPIPVVNHGGSAVSVSVTATGGPTLPAGTNVANITYAGLGTPTIPPMPANFPVTMSFTVGQGANIVTFINGRT